MITNYTKHACTCYYYCAQQPPGAKGKVDVGALTVKAVACGSSHTCAILSDGEYKQARTSKPLVERSHAKWTVCL
jgi:Regulator of chromosome condensation (RCC1) repeat